MINGNKLIELGYKPAHWFKEALDHINKNNLNDIDLRSYLDSIVLKYKLPDYIASFENPVKYFKNISIQSKDEEKNVNDVIHAMNIVMKTPTVVTGAIMPDACPVGENHIPVGGIAVTRNAIHPAMHSADICCSVMMTNFGNVSPKLVLDAAHSITHFGIGGRSEFSKLPRNLENRIIENELLGKSDRAITLARHHLGTQGDGNHFCFVGTSKNTNETIMVTHHGSRGFGAYLYSLGMKMAEKFMKNISPNISKNSSWIPYNTEEGLNYWEALQIVREWTKLNHSTIHDAVLHKLSLTGNDRFWNEHNFVFKDDDLFYHAKGATPLDDKFVPDSKNGLRLIPLNMGQPILIVRGETTENNLGFAPHGAGRNLSRTQHKLNMGDKTINQIFKEETEGLDIRFFSKKIDISELPSAYKNAAAVRQQMKEFNLGNIIDEIMPYGSIMAGGSELPHWKTKKLNKKN